MAGLVVTKAAEQQKEFTLDEVTSFLKNLQRRRMYGEVKIKVVAGRFAYVNIARGLSPGDPLDAG